jgi:LacI family transcriptional regulator
MLDKPATMRDIARHAGVSIGTVSHVINGTAGVRVKVADRVRRVMHRLGYRPSQLARGLRRKQTNILGMIVPDITNPFFPLVVRGVEDTAYQRGYRVVLCNADNDSGKEENYFRDLGSYRIAGLIMIPSADSRLATLAASDPAIAVVCVDRGAKAWSGDTITVDNSGGAYQAVRHLISMGHRRIATITGPMHVTNSIERLRGYQRALNEAGLKIVPEYAQEGRFDRISGYEKARILLRLIPRPTAIFAANDLIALGVLAALAEAELSCPQDVSLVGFDDLELSSFISPPLTSVAQPAYQMGVKAAVLLLKRLRGEDSPPVEIVLPSELRIRHSVKRIAVAAEPERMVQVASR